MKEMEVRILEIDINTIELKLNSIGAVKVKDENQINEIYDFPDKRLLNKKGYARIRTINDKLKNKVYYFLTVKKLISQEKYKTMDEHETKIENIDEARKIYENLGLQLIESIKKHRISYKYKNSLIEIDINDKSFCPFPYIEIETSFETQLHEIVKLLGYTMNDITSKTIYEILKERGIR